MSKFAVMLRYEVVSALIVEADSVEDADRIASEFEEALHDDLNDTDHVTVEARIWGNGSVDVEEADDEEAALDKLDEWLDEIDFDDEYDDDDDDDEYDDDDDDDDEDEDDDEGEEEDDADELRNDEPDLDPDDDRV